MTRDGAANLERALGRVEARLEEQGKQMAALTEMLKDQNERSSESRGKVYNRLDAMAENTGKIERRVANTERVIGEIEPLARDFGRVRERSKGVIATIILAWTLLGGFLMWMGNNILEWIAQRIGGP